MIIMPINCGYPHAYNYNPSAFWPKTCFQAIIIALSSNNICKVACGLIIKEQVHVNMYFCLQLVWNFMVKLVVCAFKVIENNVIMKGRT